MSLLMSELIEIGEEFVVVVEAIPTTLYVSASIVLVYLSKTSLVPSTVRLSLIVGVVCPNCHGHLVPIIEIQVGGLL